MRRSVRTVLVGLLVLSAAFLAVHTEVNSVLLTYRLRRAETELTRLRLEGNTLEIRRARALEGGGAR